MQKSLIDIGQGSDFFEYEPKSTDKSKWDCVKLISFCIAKEIIIRIQRQPEEWEKMFVNHVSNKELICNIYKELIELSSKITNNIIKIDKGPEETLLQGKHTNGQQVY